MAVSSKVVPTSAGRREPVPIYDATDGELDCGIDFSRRNNGPASFKPGGRTVAPIVPTTTAQSGASAATAAPQDSRAPLPPPATPSTSTPSPACNGSAVKMTHAMTATLDSNQMQDELLRLRKKLEELSSSHVEQTGQLEQYKKENVQLQTRLTDMESEAPHLHGKRTLLRKVTSRVFKNHGVIHNAPIRGRNTHEIHLTHDGRIKMLHRSRQKAEADELKVPKKLKSTIKGDAPLELVTRVNPLRQQSLENSKKDAFFQEDTPMAAVEFDCLEAISSEEHPTVMVPVNRRGVLRGRLEIQWVIKYASGMPAKVYDSIQPKRGSIVFEDGEDRTHTEMPVPNDPTWNVESVYFAQLDAQTIRTYPDTSFEARCTLGCNSQVAVYSLNTDSFPAGIDSEKASLRRLVWGFICHNYTEIPSETVKALLYSAFPCVHYYCNARVLEMILNCGVKVGAGAGPGAEAEAGAETGEGAGTGVGTGAGACDLPFVDMFDFGDFGFLWLLAAAQFVLFVLQVIFKRRKEKLRLDGKATRMLRTNMFTTMIQLSQESKSMFDPGDIPKSLDTAVADAIAKVWMNFFELAELGLVCVVQSFLTCQMASENDLSFYAQIGMYASSPVMLLIVAIVMNCRASKQFRIFSETVQADESWSAFVTMTEFCIPVILSYRQGHVAAKIFNDVHAKFNKANSAACDFSAGSVWRIRSCFQMVFFGVVVVGGTSVQRGTLKIGGFVVLMNVVFGFGTTLIQVTEVVNEMVIGCAAVRKIADILNKDTRRRVRWRNMNKDPETQRECASLGTAMTGDENSTNLEFQRIEYSYPNSHSASVCPTNLHLTCGALVCFPEETLGACKKWGSGIATMFKLMACDLPLPRGSGSLFPAAWSVICVPAQPILFDGTLMYNLAFSESHSQAPVAMDDIWDMCRAMGMSEHLIGDEDFDVGFNGEHLKNSDRIMVSLGRALLYQTDVILISSALDVLGERHGLQVLRYLRGYIQRGALPDVQPKVNQAGLLPLKFKHIKTVLYMSKFGVLQQEADQNVVALVTPPDDIPSPKAKMDKIPELSGAQAQHVPSGAQAQHVLSIGALETGIDSTIPELS